jgi:16S rRNA (guanine527-N7)-methyltransferase
LLAVVERAQRLGYAGGATEAAAHLRHALDFGTLDPPPPGAHAVDLGSGNGLPGLVLAMEWPRSSWWLIEASSSRSEFLRWAVAALELTERVVVVEMPAERSARDERYRARASLVVAKAFGPPAVTAECGAGFLVRGGRLVVSAAPDSATERWPATGLSLLGLELASGAASPPRLDVLVRTGNFPDKYPRREGVPRRRPLF